MGFDPQLEEISVKVAGQDRLRQDYYFPIGMLFNETIKPKTAGHRYNPHHLHHLHFVLVAEKLG